MSIRTGTYVNGQWTTRNVDIHHIIAQNRDHHHHPGKSIPSETDALQQLPQLGILTQTLIRSPVIKWIIPAYLRHAQEDDVVFIYDNWIEIKQVQVNNQAEIIKGKDSGDEMLQINNVLRSIHLQDIAMKVDFDSSILAARTLGLPRQDAPYSPEITESAIPPQILVMTLESRVLLFIFCASGNYVRSRFVSYKRPLPSARLESQQTGRHLAVDPRSRAMAVGAPEGSFILYALKSMEDLRRDLNDAENIDADWFRPVVGERHIAVDGVIVQMEFLYPSEDESLANYVILLLVISKDRCSRLICYEWDSRRGIETARQRGMGQRLHADDQLPLLLVPLTKSTTFMLVSRKRVVVYRDILTGNATPHVLTLFNTTEEPELSERLPVWTQWARPVRHATHEQDQDNIYLSREDGIIQYLEIKDNNAQMLDCTHKIGPLGVNIDSSFTCLNLGYLNSDLLITGGDMSDGGQWLFGPRLSAIKLSNIPNWSPMIDLAVVSHVDDAMQPLRSVRTSWTKQGERRLFASTGQGSHHGAITEVRYGTKASNKITLSEIQRIIQVGVVGMWALGDTSDEAILVLSHLMHTSLLQVHSASEATDVTGSNDIRIDYEAKTLAAAMTNGRLLIQVTNRSINATLCSAQLGHFNKLETILAACIQDDRDHGGHPLMLAAVRRDSETYLQLGHFTTDNQSINFIASDNLVLLSSEPSVVSLLKFDKICYALVGTLSGTLQVFHVEAKTSLAPVFEFAFHSDVAICDSIAAFPTALTSNSSPLIVCGLRNGSIEVLSLNLDPLGDNLLESFDKIQIGSTSTTVASDALKSSRAILHCGREIFTLEYVADGSNIIRAPGSVSRIWFTDSDMPSYQQASIHAVSQGKSGFAKDLLFCVEGNQIQIVELSQHPEPCIVPRQVAIHATPTKILYSPRLEKFIIIYYAVVPKNSPHENGYNVRRNQHSLQYTVAIVDPDAEPIKPDPDGDFNDNTTIKGKLGERFLGVAEWLVELDGKIHHILVINTIIEHSPPLKISGRILLFSVSNGGILSLKRSLDINAPVYSLAIYDKRSILYGCGTDLCLQYLDVASSGCKFQDPIKIDLKSQALYLSVERPYVYITTNKNSLSIFKVDKDILEFQANDREARNGVFHHSIPECSVILASQKGGTVTGLRFPVENGNKIHMSAIFEVALPRCITRFRGISRPLWYKPVKGIVSSNAIIGTSTDGCLFQFDILEETSWRLLLFIQNMSLRNSKICPFADALLAHRRPLMPSSAKVSDMHINGDVLRRLIDYGAEELLGGMLKQDNISKILSADQHVLHVVQAQRHDRDAMDIDSGRADAVVQDLARLEALDRRDLLVDLAANAGLVGNNEEDLIKKVATWMTCCLQRAL